MAGRALHWIHLLDGRELEGLGIHRVTGINHLARIRALDKDAVQSALSLVTRCLQGRFRQTIPAEASALRPAHHTHLTCALTAIVCGLSPISFDTTKW